MLDVEFVSHLTGFVVAGKKSDQELQEYIDASNIQKKLWFVDVSVFDCLAVRERIPFRSI